MENENKNMQNETKETKKIHLPHGKEEWKTFGKKAGKAAIRVGVLALTFVGGALIGGAIERKKAGDPDDSAYLPEGGECDGETDEACPFADADSETTETYTENFEE